MSRAGFVSCHAFLRRIATCAFALAFGLTLRAALPVPNAYNVRVWQTDDGLPQNSVHAIAQSADGYLWVGTHEGLVRFDGVRFTAVTEEALQNGWITALCATSDGSLWIACEGQGVARLKDGRFSWFTETNGLPGHQVRCLLESADGALWIGGENGLTRFKDGSLKTFTDRGGLGDNSVRALSEDATGTLRVATRRGLSTLNTNGQFTTTTLPVGMVGNALRCVEVDDEGRIWIGSNEGLNSLTGDERRFYSINDGLPDRITTVLYKDRRGELWVGTYGGLASIVNQQIVSQPMNEGACESTASLTRV